MIVKRETQSHRKVVLLISSTFRYKYIYICVKSTFRKDASQYRNFRSFTRTGRLLHTAKKKVNRLPALVDNPHVVIQPFWWRKRDIGDTFQSFKSCLIQLSKT